MTQFLGARLDMKKPPKNLEEALNAAGNAVLSRLMKEDLPHLVLITFGDRPMRWELADSPPDVDDVVRAICEHENAFCAALIFPCPPPAGVDAPRAVMIRTEDAKHRVEVVIGFRGEGDDRECRFYAGPTKEISPTWIGVPPTDTEVSLTEEGVSYFGPPIEA